MHVRNHRDLYLPRGLFQPARRKKKRLTASR